VECSCSCFEYSTDNYVLVMKLTLQSYLLSWNFIIKKTLLALFPLHQGVSPRFTPLCSVLSSRTHQSSIISILMTVICSFLFLFWISRKLFLTWKLLSALSLLRCQPNLISLNQSKTEFILIGLPKQLLKSLTLLFSFLNNFIHLLYGVIK